MRAPMIDVATSPVFTVGRPDPRRVSLHDILTSPHEGVRFRGPTPYLEALQLFIAASATADLLGSAVNSEMPLDEAARIVLAKSNRHPLDGDGPRYGQVRLSPDSATMLGVNALEGTFFPGLSPAAKGEGGMINFGWRAHASQDGFCPSCALLGLTFVSKCAPGTGGKVAGLWKSGMFTFPIFSSLRDTVLVNALAWARQGPGVPAEWGTLGEDHLADPWADERYTQAIVTGTLPDDRAFRTLKHVRNWTPWALWLQWEYKAGTCTLCGLPTDALAVGATGPVRDETGFSGKLGWPKKLNRKNILANEVIPSPFTPCRHEDGFAVPICCKQTQLLSFASAILDAQQNAARVLHIRCGDDQEDGVSPVSQSILVAALYNDHKGKDTYAYTTHIPIADDPDYVRVQCEHLNDEFEVRTNQLRAGLAQGLEGASTESILLLWRNISAEFPQYLGKDGLARWGFFLKKEALALYDRVTAHRYETGADPRAVTFGRSTVLANPKP